MLCIGCDTTACWKVSSITFPDHASCDTTLLRCKRTNWIGCDGNVPFKILLICAQICSAPLSPAPSLSLSYLFSFLFFATPPSVFLSLRSRFPSFLCPWKYHSRDQHEGNGPCFVISFHYWQFLIPCDDSRLCMSATLRYACASVDMRACAFYSVNELLFSSFKCLATTHSSREIKNLNYCILWIYVSEVPSLAKESTATKLLCRSSFSFGHTGLLYDRLVLLVQLRFQIHIYDFQRWCFGV